MSKTPLEPIELTLDGDYLCEYPNSNTSDQSILIGCVGTHKHCGGFMNRKHSNEKFDSIVCRSCYLRIVFYKEIKTYGELREYLTIEFNNLRAHRGSPWQA